MASEKTPRREEKHVGNRRTLSGLQEAPASPLASGEEDVHIPITDLIVSGAEITEPELGRTAVLSGLQPTGIRRLPFSEPPNTKQPRHTTITHRVQTALFLADLTAQLLSRDGLRSVMQDHSLWLAEPSRVS